MLISNALPGMVEAPPGSLNGALTPSELNSTLGSSGPTGALGQAIADGDVSAYVRTWSNQPPNGAFIQVIAAQFPSLADASAALAGADHAVSGIHFGHFPVPEIPQAEGFSVIANSEAGVVTESVVQFAKGAVLFEVAAGQVTTAVNSGAPELSDADAVQIARQQAALAPGPALGPTDPSANMTSNTAYQAGRYFGVAVLTVLVAGLIVLLVQRRSKRQIAVALPAAGVGRPVSSTRGWRWAGLFVWWLTRGGGFVCRPERRRPARTANCQKGKRLLLQLVWGGGGDWTSCCSRLRAT